MICAIIVHAYKKRYNQDEEDSIKNLFSKLGDRYHIYCICPASLNLSYYKETFKFYKYLRLNDIFFTYPQGYNYMMTNIKFYSYFKDYEYIIIHHPDAWLFNDDLEYWLNKKYITIAQNDFLYFVKRINLFVGGFIIRDIKYCINLLSCKTYHYQQYWYNEIGFNEDAFFSINKVIDRKNPKFPSNKERFKFGQIHIELCNMNISMIILNNYEITFSQHHRKIKNQINVYKNYNLI